MSVQSQDRGLERFATLVSRWVPDAITAIVLLTFSRWPSPWRSATHSRESWKPTTRVCGCCCRSPCR